MCMQQSQPPQEVKNDLLLCSSESNHKISEKIPQNRTMQVTFPVHDHRSGLGTRLFCKDLTEPLLSIQLGSELHMHQSCMDFDKASAKIKKSNTILGFESKKECLFHLLYKSLDEPTV